MNDVSTSSDLLKPCHALMQRCYPVSSRVNRGHWSDNGSSGSSTPMPFGTGYALRQN
jgi:hypothetical protein